MKHRTILMTVYAAGLRLSEATHLKVSDIDGGRMQMRVEQGKGKKDRYVPLSAVLLVQLREYWRRYRPGIWLFPNRSEDLPISEGTVQKVFHRAKKKARILKPASAHTLRHSFATYAPKSGVDLFTLQHLLGHAHIQTTLIYLHLQHSTDRRVVSPPDRLMEAGDE